MNTQSLGVVAPVPMGAWSATIQYQKLNIVTQNGGAYMAKQPNLGVVPTETDNAYWLLLAKNGANGTNGTNGLNGTNGADGIGISSATINASGELTLTYSNGTMVNLGNVVGEDGTNGTDGKTYVPSVGNDGVLSWEENEINPPAPVNIVDLVSSAMPKEVTVYTHGTGNITDSAVLTDMQNIEKEFIIYQTGTNSGFYRRDTVTADYVRFVAIKYQNGSAPCAVIQAIVVELPDGTVSFNQFVYAYSTPEPTSANAGKVLQVATGGGYALGDVAVTVDDALSATSTNPVQNSVITAKLDEIETQIGAAVSTLATI